MRHLFSFLVSVILAPVIWVLVALGETKIFRQLARGPFDRTDFVVPLLLLVGAGILIGLIASTRISPVGPAVVGLAFLALQVWYVVDIRQVFDAMPDSLFDTPRAATTPLDTGTATVLGVLLLMSVLSVRRWQRWPKPQAGYQPPGAGPAPVAGGPVGPEPVGVGAASRPEPYTFPQPGADRTERVGGLGSALEAQPDTTSTLPAQDEPSFGRPPGSSEPYQPWNSSPPADSSWSRPPGSDPTSESRPPESRPPEPPR